MSAADFLTSPATEVSTSSASPGSSTSSSAGWTGHRSSFSAEGFWDCLPSFTAMRTEEEATMTPNRAPAYPKATRYAAVVLVIFLILVMVGL